MYLLNIIRGLLLDYAIVYDTDNQLKYHQKTLLIT